MLNTLDMLLSVLMISVLIVVGLIALAILCVWVCFWGVIILILNLVGNNDKT